MYTLTLANLLPLKRLERVVGAIDHLRRTSAADIRALIGGDGLTRARVEGEVERRGLGGRAAARLALRDIDLNDGSKALAMTGFSGGVGKKQKTRAAAGRKAPATPLC